jgi:hypothetical protein|tara:strand:- start:110 stop:340 length:231 start_codon:yes stop_codon:yes gene_type:complete
MEAITNIITVVTSIVCIASIVCSLTDTPKDDALIGRLYKILEIAALNIGKAKQSSAEVKPVKMTANASEKTTDKNT